MSLPLTHAGLSAPGISAALDLKFASTLSLTSSSGITPSFSRASTGTYFNSPGVLTSAAINAPRFDHTFNGTSWVSRGLLVEEQRTNSLQYSESFNTSPYWAAASGATITANQAVAPDGTTTADNIAGVNGFYQNSAGMGSSTATSTASIFAKANGSSSITLRINEWGSGTNYVEGTFNLSAGTATASNSGSGSGATASIVNCGNGWFRCIITGKPSTTAGTCGFYPYGMTTSVYCWGAQFEAGASFATSYIPSTGAGSTTRSADVCQITGSDFTSFYNSSEGSIVAEFDRLYVPTTDGSSVYSIRDAGNNNVISVWFPTSTGQDQVEIYSSGPVALFNLGTPASVGVITKIATGYKANDFAASKNGAAVLTDTSGAVPVSPTFMAIGGVSTLNGHIARLRYFNKRLTDKQLEDLCKPEEQLKLDLKFSENLSLTPVVGPTPSFSRASTGTYFNASGILTSAAINAPRFDHTYDGTNWISRGLLIEEQRTNLLPRSEEFNTGWTNNDINISANSVTAPDGTTTADNLVPNTVNTNHRLYQGPAGSGAASVSVFAKSTGYGWLQVRVGAGGGTSVTVNFNVVSGAIGDTILAGGATASNQSIENVGNGWWRCKFTANSVPAFTTVIMPRPDNASVEGQAYAGDGVKGVAVWGAQLENASFPTSYIPTTSSSVVRSADVCQITGTDFSGIWNQGEGSAIANYDFLAAPADRASSRVWYASDGAYTNGMWVQSGSSDGFYVYQSGSVQAGLTATALPSGSTAKFSSAYRLNDFAASFNGAAVLTDTSGNVPTVNRMEIGYMSDISGRVLNGHISRLRYYAIRLPNRLLIAKSQ